MNIELLLTTQIWEPMHMSASFSFTIQVLKRESFHYLRVNKFVCKVGIFLLTISSSSLASSCGPLIICYGTSLLTGIFQLWLHLDWLFSIVGHYLLGMILTLYVCLYIYIYMYVCMWLFNGLNVCGRVHPSTHTYM